MTTPATDIWSFTVTIPAGTTTDLGFVQDCSMPPCSVVGIRWRVPPGPSGFMGFQVTSDGAPVIPRQIGAYIVADNEAADWPIRGYQTSGSWQVSGYNTDNYDHSVYLDFLIVPPGQDVAAAQTSNAGSNATDSSLLQPSPPDASTFQSGLQVP